MVMTTDSIADMITRLRNGQMRRKSRVIVPLSKMNESILKVLFEEGYIRSYKRIQSSPNKSSLEVGLKYHNDRPVIREILRQSKSSRRIYTSAKAIPVVYDGLGISILSTNKGVVSGALAAQLGVGGEFLCSVF